MSEYDNATFKWCGKPNPYPKGTDPWKRTEIGRKMGQTGRKTVGEFFAATRPYKTWKTLVGLRLIEIEGYKGRATESEMEAIASNSGAFIIIEVGAILLSRAGWQMPAVNLFSG